MIFNFGQNSNLVDEVTDSLLIMRGYFANYGDVYNNYANNQEFVR